MIFFAKSLVLREGAAADTLLRIGSPSLFVFSKGPFEKSQSDQFWNLTGSASALIWSGKDAVHAQVR